MFSGVVFTLYFDGSHNNQDRKAGAGCIIRDDSGEVVVAAAYNLVGPDLSWCDEATAEVVGLRNGLRLAKDRNVKLSVIKGDNQEVIDLVLGQGQRQPEPLTGIIAEIKKNIGFASLQRIDRAANKVAEKLAFMGSLLVTGSRVFTKYDVPSQIVELINQEKARNADGEEDNRLAIGIRNVGLVATGAALLWGAISLAPSLMRSLNNDNNNNNNNNNNAYYTLEYFGSDRNQLKKASAGCIIRNERSFVVAGSYNLDYNYPEDCHVAIAEAIALWKGLELAVDKSVKLDVIHGRNSEVRSRVLGLMGEPKNRDLRVIIGKIKCGLREQGFMLTDDNTIKLVDEDSIKVARELARYATEGGLLPQKAVVYNIVEQLPYRAAELFDASFA